MHERHRRISCKCRSTDRHLPVIRWRRIRHRRYVVRRTGFQSLRPTPNTSKNSGDRNRNRNSTHDCCIIICVHPDAEAHAIAIVHYFRSDRQCDPQTRVPDKISSGNCSEIILEINSVYEVSVCIFIIQLVN